MAELGDAVEGLRSGKGRIFSICGDAGTGKSRLVEDFKATLDLEEIQWIEGHAYAYAQNIPYFPLINFLNGIFHIEERDSSEKIREKIESGIKGLIGNSREMVPYVGNLYALTYPELEDVSAELWKNRLEEAVQAILTALAKRAPTVFFLEDLHWADRSFVGLLRRALLEIRQPAIVLCVYRPTFSLFTSHQLGSVNKLYHEIRLQDLSLSDAQDMLASLLRTENIPSELKRWVQNKTEGNPFYLEELVNTLIESEVLIQENGDWKITRPIKETDISSSIHGLISGRLDRLEKETKRILQEASVIGRAFLYEILIKVSELEDRIDRGLSTLERLDLIRTRSFEPDLEYMFKHPLTQEVVYNGLLKKERQEIHEQIAQVMERLFEDRLSEFYETLAYHFALGRSVNKAVEYLVKAGEKSLARYAVEEAHEHYKKAYDILGPKEDKTEEEKKLLIDMLNSWGYVYYYLGDMKDLSICSNLIRLWQSPWATRQGSGCFMRGSELPIIWPANKKILMITCAAHWSLGRGPATKKSWVMPVHGSHGHAHIWAFSMKGSVMESGHRRSRNPSLPINTSFLNLSQEYAVYMCGKGIQKRFLRGQNVFWTMAKKPQIVEVRSSDIG